MSGNYMQIWLDENYTLLYSNHDEGKTVVSERFIRTLKMKIHKEMSYYPEQDSHIGDKVKAVFDLSNYAAK